MIQMRACETRIYLSVIPLCFPTPVRRATGSAWLGLEEEPPAVIVSADAELLLAGSAQCAGEPVENVW